MNVLLLTVVLSVLPLIVSPAESPADAMPPPRLIEEWRVDDFLTDATVDSTASFSLDPDEGDEWGLLSLIRRLEARVDSLERDCLRLSGIRMGTTPDTLRPESWKRWVVEDTLRVRQ